MASRFNAARRLAGGGRQNDIGNDIDALRKMGSPSVLSRAVVVDVLYDIDEFSNEDLDLLAASVSNPEVINVMPNGSVVARITTDQQEQTTTQGIILFPFFSSHLMLPVKAGENVWVMFEDIQNQGFKVGYWLTRPHEWRTVEDANFTHADRRFDPTMHPDNYNSIDRSERTNEAVPPGFQNGGNTSDSVSLKPEPGVDVNGNPFETIFQTAKANNASTFEPVPRRKRRPGELVLQGSNNAFLTLGEDRISGTTRNENDISGSAGTIDLVAGLGRDVPVSQTEDPSKTSARLIENRRGLVEADRAPHRRNKLDNAEEGNNDFEIDASRVYIAQQTKADENFGLTEIEFPDNVLIQAQPEGTETKNRAYVVAKSDHLRLIARRTEEVEGSILLIKEGEPDDVAYVLMTKDGRIQINGPQIFIGRATDGSQEPSFDSQTAGPEPYLRYTKIREAGESLADTIDKLKSDMRKEIEKVRDECANTLQQAAIALQTSTCTPFGPDTGAIAAATILQQGSAKIRTANTPNVPTTDRNVRDGNKTTIDKIDESRSIRIFGE